MNQTMKLLDVVALLEDCLEQGMVRGQVGTIVEVHEPGVFEVEFSDTQGKTYVLKTLRAEQLMILHHQPTNQDVITAGG
jgi:MarR-like DNA-binding transcriptional regulator SgrR of sgrS sRNA